MEWRPIEEAPKDGRHMLLYPAVWIGYWRPGREPGMNAEMSEMAKRGGWTRAGYQDFDWHPTHWCPLPAPPQDKSHDEP